MDAPRELKIDKFALNKYSTEQRIEFPFTAELNSMAVQSAAERAWSAISRFYDNCKSGKHGKEGFPQFQRDCRSVEYKTSGWKLHKTKRRITFTDKKGIGELKLLGKWDIQSYELKDIKRVRLIRRADGYYAQFCIGIDVVDIQPKTGVDIGLDVGIESFYTDSNGHHEPNPKFLRKAEKSIKHSQKRIYKKVKGSSGRKKARKLYAKKHSVKFDKVAIAVAPHYTSQKCSSCGVIVKKSLSTRTHNCSCGCELHRDTNAAINILNLAKARGGHPQSNATGVGISTLVGENLLEQILTMNVESPRLKTRGVST